MRLLLLWLPLSSGVTPVFCTHTHNGAVMSEDTVRQTRSQKRALERDSQAADVKRLKLDGVERSRSETAAAVQDSSILKATIKVELQTGDEPMDTSNTAMKREASSPSPEDVIVLSDEAPSPPVNGGNHVKELDTDLLMRSSPKERERVIKQLKEELRLEEAKLILLKKLRQSHKHKDKSAQKPAAPVSSAPPPLVKGSAAGKTAQPVISARASGMVIPPPLVRGAQLSKHGLAGAQIILPPLVRGAQSISVSPQQISVLRQQQNSSGPPPLLLAPRATLSSVSGQKIIQPGLIRMTSISSTGLLLSISQAAGSKLKSGSNASPSPDSRQAAKLALRKQLEKTLLEIPPPKPSSPQLTFVPSAASNQFIYLLGLEEVVQNLLESLGRGKQGLYAGLVVSAGEPSCCSQCQTDFTCRWRRDEGGAVMCEQCMSSNQKKLLKAEHTNRLKAAFVKALQQEREIDQRVLQQATPPASSSSAHGMKADQVKVRSSSVQQTQGRLGPSVSRHAAAVRQVSRAVPHSFSSSSQLQNAVAAAALVSRPGKHAERQGSKVSSSVRKRSSGAAGVTMAYVNPSLSVQKPSAVERHREFLLGMIASRSVSQTTNTWK
ncbi:transcriptional repressor p66-alpha-like isoform X1 [Sinocyclocheilus rhinocerous]|uniref:transcriptional repressor p66-alpha-like isoform X1 n=2 Tax=Sinocyclocheilus rhinocerous TaxID=307959 RepID=UPI0007B9D23A|nr:PREDICTED: transcriptional repressor p66-alpha-like isoform X1 [Sinocyclocheilus rhinocerous]